MPSEICKSIVGIALGKKTLLDCVFDQISYNKPTHYTCKATQKALEEYHTNQNGDTAKKLWKELLIDAICLLKINDEREKTSKIKELEAQEFAARFESIRNTSSFGIKELEEYFLDYVEFERVLYHERFYRDHVHHVLQVWALGTSLLFNEKNNFSIHFSENFKLTQEDFNISKDTDKTKPKKDHNNDLNISKTELWAMWTIIALCHDLGYPVEKASRINQKVKKIVNNFGCITFNELSFNFDMLNSFIINKFLKIISSKIIINQSNKFLPFKSPATFSTQIQQKYFDKFSKSLEDYKHGMFSGLLLYKKLVYFLETDYTPKPTSQDFSEDKRQFFIRREILRAICSHTCPKIYHINLNTLSFLLILCDEIQEWNRPSLETILNDSKKNQDSHTIRIEKFETEKINTTTEETKTTIEIYSKYEIDPDDDFSNIQHIVFKKFENFIYLLRSAKGDSTRKDIFIWKSEFKKNIVFTFEFGAEEIEGFKTTVSFNGTTPQKIDIYGDPAAQCTNLYKKCAPGLS